MRLTQIYTKVGDKGTTLLSTGERVSKAAPRIEAYGTVDELNAVVGLLRDQLQVTEPQKFKDLIEELSKVQNELFQVGGELSIPDFEKKGIKLSVVKQDSAARLEKQMDAFLEALPPLENFILPGGHLANAWTHLARTVCRRAERRLIALHETEPQRADLLIFLNRLSDWFFVAGRVISKRLGVHETLWQQQKG